MSVATRHDYLRRVHPVSCVQRRVNPPFRASAFPRANYYNTALDSDQDSLAKRLDESS
jgi:hypothetical protein